MINIFNYYNVFSNILLLSIIIYLLLLKLIIIHNTWQIHNYNYIINTL